MTLLSLFLLQTLSAVDTACAKCHPKQVAGYESNAMSKALYRATEAVALKENPKLEFVLGKFRYTIEQQSGEPVYAVTDGQQTLTAKLQFAFGQGAAGQTYVYQQNGRWYESRLSYYAKLKGLDLTMGAPPGEPKDLREAAGREMTLKDTVACFSCHTTHGVKQEKGASPQVDFKGMQLGVGCENCHGPAQKHVQGFQSRKMADASMPKLAKLTTEEQSDLCGRCHRTWGDIAANGPRGIGNVRFQPYRIANAKCYDATDRRIACTGCHDVHAPLQHDPASYDRNCKSCHTAKISAGRKASKCPKADANCVSCHMPRYEIPGSHHEFTDHQIRVVKSNETYPN